MRPADPASAGNGVLMFPEDLRGPTKRSVTIAGHATSISLEPIFWTALVAAAGEEAIPLSALVARLDAVRIEAPVPPNLASFIRVWLFRRAVEPARDQ